MQFLFSFIFQFNQCLVFPLLLELWANSVISFKFLLLCTLNVDGTLNENKTFSKISQIWIQLKDQMIFFLSVIVVHKENVLTDSD